jgi:fluoroacetyl-CoA thioesterase
LISLLDPNPERRVTGIGTRRGYPRNVASVPVATGQTAQVGLVVGEADTATALGTGDVAVLATPRVVALCEKATVAALGDSLDSGQTSVGFRVEVSHLVPVAVGTAIVASASLERIEGKRLVFNVNITAKCGLVAAGRVTRVLVDRSSFLEKAH